MTTNAINFMWEVIHVCFELFNFKTGSLPDNKDSLLSQFYTNSYQLAVDKQKEYVKEAKREHKRLNYKILDERTYKVNDVNVNQIIFEKDERRFVTFVMSGLLRTIEKIK